MTSKCPHCKSAMLGASPFCYACCRPWEVLVYAPPAPDPVAYTRPRRERTVGNGSRCLSLPQIEAIRERLASGKYGWQSKLAREYFVGVATVNRIAKEMRVSA